MRKRNIKRITVAVVMALCMLLSSANMCFAGDSITKIKYNTVYPGGESTYKFEVDKTAAIKISFFNINSSVARMNYTILDKNKKELFEPRALTGWSSVASIRNDGKTCRYTALDKGTYYVKLGAELKEGRNCDKPFDIKISKTAVKEKSGDKKSNAVKIVKGKTVKGTLTLNKKDEDWYKFSVSSKQTVKFTAGIKLSPGNLESDDFPGADVSINLCDSKGKVIEYVAVGVTQNPDISGIILKKKIKKGTYYIQVTGSSKEVAGQYSIKRLL